MLQRTHICATISSRNRANQIRRMQQFSNLDNFSRGSDPDFDAHVQEKRDAERWEGFDQRVERAFQSAWKLHKAEVWNAFKRQIRENSTGSGSGSQDEVTRITPVVMLDVEKRLADRKEWLRSVWAQIDADYRSGDASRAARATADIDSALAGRGNEYMSWAYETKHDMRFMGPKEKEEAMQRLNASEFPEMMEEEADRYMNRRMSMADIEEAVGTDFGIAGQQHWQLLQRDKDEEYMKKFDDALEIYEELKKNETEAFEAQDGRNRQMLMARVDAARVRLRSALAHEDHRQEMVDAHREMAKERAEAEKARRREMLREIAMMKNNGVDAQQIHQMVQRKTYAETVRRNNARNQEERTEVLQKKRQLQETMRAMQRAVDQRDGLTDFSDEGKRVLRTMSMDDGEAAVGSSGDDAKSMETLMEEARAIARRRAKNPADVEVLTKKALWDLVHKDKERTPEMVIHQARLDAEKTYSAVYRKTKAQRLRNKQYRDVQTMSDAQGQEGQLFHTPQREESVVGWGLNSFAVHNLDRDPKKKYTQDTRGFHVMDEKTGDVDKQYEKRHGEGPIFRGDRKYKPTPSDIGTSL